MLLKTLSNGVVAIVLSVEVSIEINRKHYFLSRLHRNKLYIHFLAVLLFSLHALSTEEENCICGGGPLALTLSLLTSSPLALDLAAHQDTLLLAGNLLSGKYL